ncbi:MAG: TonB-dependent receptor [Bryobacteraceae bacterium]
MKMFQNRFALFTFALLFCANAFSQEFRATLIGRVTDPQGAVVPGVKITATLLNTGAKSNTVSGSDGQYTLPFLPPGAYNVTAEVSGFKTFVRQGLPVSTGDRIGLDIKLQLGETSEAITVTGDAPLLDTTTATAGQVITSRQIEDLPMNGRTPLVLAQLAMGVVPNSDPKFNRPFDNAGPSGFSMGGAPSQSNELLIDGAPDTTGDSRVAYNPPVDAVQEVRVHAFEADAAYGHTGGGTANVVLKGGTNDFHGSLYEFNQTSALDATPFFTNKAGLKNPVSRYNQWGFTAGGPWLIPKVYNGRNRVFWFFGWEGINDSFPEPLTETVPTAAERGGDFSALLRLGSNYQIYDPSTGAAQGSRIARQPLTGNVIPASRISPIALNVLKFYPLPNQAGTSDGKNNYLANTVRADTYNGEIGRLDFNISDRHKLFWDFRHNDRIEDRNNYFNNIATGRALGRINWGSTLDDVFTLTPTTVLDVRMNWTRFIEGTNPYGQGFDFTKLGLPSSLKALSPNLEFPRFSFSSISETETDTAGSTPFDVYQIFGTVVKIAGNHSLKMGTDLRLYRESSVGYGYSSGQYTFNSNWTRGPLDNSPGSPFGQDVAAFLLGLPTGGGFDLNAFRTNQADYYALFLQDDYRVKPNLTLNLGLRYERDLPTTERYNRSVNGFDTTTPNPIAAAAIAAYAQHPIPEISPSQFKVPGGLLFASSQNRDIYHTQAHYFSPRFGFAWTPHALNGKTVIRGGAGVFLFPFGTTGVNQPGFSQTTSVVPTLNSYLTPSATLANPFPTGIEQPLGASQGLATYLGKGLTFSDPNPLNPYSVRWELDVQHELPGHMVLEVAYIGNHAVHLPEGSTPSNSNNTQLNYTPGQYASRSPVRDQATIDRLSALVPNPFAGLIPGTSLNGSTVGLQTLLQAYPEFGGISLQRNPGGSSYFESMDVRLEKRYSSGFNLLFNYTYSKLIEEVRLLNDFDLSPETRVSGDDRPQRVVVSSSYELPFGRGKRFLSSSHGVVNAIAGGWVLNGIYTYQRGAPLTWGNDIFYGGNLNLNPRQVNGPAFDTARFNTNSQQQLSDNIRTFPTRFGNLRQDGANNFDLSLIKNIAIKERVHFQLRFESFNALNHPEFDTPNLSPTSSSFGLITNQPNLARNIQLGGRLVW